MTLLIAYLLMWQMGIDNPIAWVSVFVLWILHFDVHAHPSESKLKEIIRNGGK